VEFQIEGKPSQVTSEAPERPIHHAWIAEDPHRPGQLLLCATDSYAFVRVPVGAPPEGFEHALGQVPHDALAYAEDMELPIRLAERHVMVGTDASFRRQGQMEFPNLQDLVPPEPEKPMRFAIDTRLLSNLARAMGDTAVELVFDLSKAIPTDGGPLLYNSPVAVRRYTGPSGEQYNGDGLVMPIKVLPALINTDDPEPAVPPVEEPPIEQPPPPNEPQPPEAEA
jgi:hypothetical protein